MRLVRATGEEGFVTAAAGERLVEHPDAGEVVWCDDEGVICRRWNWRQGPRTRLAEESVNALFLLEGMGPDAGLEAAGRRTRRTPGEVQPGARFTVRAPHQVPSAGL